MSTEQETNLQISLLRSFEELTEADQTRCFQHYLEEPLAEKHLLHKYLKRTSSLEDRASEEPLENECFLTFDEFKMNDKYSALIFCLCGISHPFHYVLYLSIHEDARMESVEAFILEILANILIYEIPQLTKYTVRFVLCRDNDVTNKVMAMISDAGKNISLFNAFHIIRDPLKLRDSNLHNPYVQQAWSDIMLENIGLSIIRPMFSKHRALAKEKEHAVLKQFIDDFYVIARDLLDVRFEINLRLCTMERVLNFEHIVLSHMKSYENRDLSRMFLFNLLRALIIIYAY
ncbi:uncharacterized protein LOC108600789 [Drosophila busckii]|uniref:uncharacterized protein LOC108600789 n=1 Tax=Drosophila busckii TaxID=30019 RepID=UPI00083EC96F|nr:uncharacterized protein LOC108600789 [Drosophila busckii]